MTAFLTSGHPGTLLARISIFETVASDKLRVVRAKANKLSKSLETLFSMDGGPLTDNVVFVSDQRVLVPNRSAVPRPRIGTGLAEGETGQAKPDWPPKVTGFQTASFRRQPCVPRCFSGHCDLAKPALRPLMFFRRLASNFSGD